MSSTAAQRPGDGCAGGGWAATAAAARFLHAPLVGWKRFRRLKKYLNSGPRDPGVLMEMVATCAHLRSNIDGIEAEVLQRLLQVPARSDWSEELASRLALSTRAAEGKLDRAAALDEYIEVHFALLGGDLDSPKARVFIDEVKTLPIGAARAVHRALLPAASTLTVGQLRHRLRTAVLAVDADSAQERHEHATQDRYVRAEPADDGMAYLTFYLPATDAAAAMSVLDALAGKSGPEDERPIAARRVDAFMAIIQQILGQGVTPDGKPVPTQHRKRPHIVFTVAQSTLDGQDDAPGYLAGHGPLAADIIRHLAPMFGDQDDVGPSADGAGNGAAVRVTNPEATRRTVRTDPVDGTAQPPVSTPPGYGAAAPGYDAAAAPGTTGSPADESLHQRPEQAQDQVRDRAATAEAPREAEASDAPEATKTDAAEAEAPSDPVGALAAMGIVASDSYQPGTQLREFILTRDVTCRFPTCRQPGRRCQIDHIMPFDPARPAWAQTHQGNLHLLCARHHGLKTAGTWTVDRDEITGDTHWTSPLGYAYTRPAEIINPAHEVSALARHLAAMHTEHDDQPELWQRAAPLAPGVIDETEFARLTCTNLAHARPGACDCAQRAEAITAILSRLQPPEPAEAPRLHDSEGFPTTTDPPPF